MTRFNDGFVESTPVADSSSATVDYAVSLTENANATDTPTATADFVVALAENANATDTTKPTVFYWHPRDDSRHLEHRSIHDVLTDRERVSDPTGSHDLMRSQHTHRRR